MNAMAFDLFGGTRPWCIADWTDSDDRVRGGQSESHLTLHDDVVAFSGTLDIETLGGAGFASQRTVGEDHRWDLASSDGLRLVLDRSTSDDKRYTFIVKDELLPKDPDSGREQATTSWEYDFQVSDGDEQSDGNSHFVSIPIAWDDLQPTYRGKRSSPKRPLNQGNIKRISIMMRSFFGTQQGPFSLCIVKISATNELESGQVVVERPATSSTFSSASSPEKTHASQPDKPTASVWSRLFSSCCRL